MKLQSLTTVNRNQASSNKDGLPEGTHPSEPTVSKLDVVLTFHIEVTVMEVRGLRQLAPNREIYCTMEIEGSERLQTEHVPAKKPLWDTQGDFTTNHPLPVLKIKLYAVNPSVLSLEDKELGKLVLRPTVLSSRSAEWCPMQATSAASAPSNTPSGGDSSNADNDEELRIRVTVRMDKPQQLKHCGYLYGIGKSTWHTLKKRYHILIQVSQYTFVMCSYKDKKAKPTEMLQLEGYTVDFIEPPTDLIMEHCAEIATSEHHHHQSTASTTLGLAGRLANVILKQPSQSLVSASGGDHSSIIDGVSGTGGGSDHHHASSGGNDGNSEQPSAIQTAAALSDELHNKFYFNLVKEGDSIVFACDDEQECSGWVMALYRATGQAHKPTPLREQYAASSSAGGSHYLDNAFAYQSSAYQPAKLVGSGPGLSGINGTKGSASSSVEVANQRARKHGMHEFISADPKQFQHNYLFRYLQNETLRYRLGDDYCSLGWFSCGQIFVLDEYCARYGVRTCYRHLAYLDSLLEFSGRGYFIDHTLLNYGYDFCACQVSGRAQQAHPIGSVNLDLRPNQVATVTIEERDMFFSIKSKLLKMIERQISNFNTSFPFGKPEGALKSALSLLERVLVNQDITRSMLQNEEVRALIRRCLEKAALNSYTKISGEVNLNSPAPVGSISASLATPANQLNNTSSNQQQPDGISLISTTGSSSGHPIATTNAQPNIGASSSSNVSICSVSSGPRSIEQNISTIASSRIDDQAGGTIQSLTMAQIIQNDQIRGREKLRFLVRLAEICCEQVEEDNDYFSDAFAWHSDLMMEHFELFWSLFGVDMEKILTELGHLNGQAGATNQTPQQTNDQQLQASNRDLFALFQVINNHMSRPNQMECKKFKKYLCDMFKPKLIRHIDICESSLIRMLSKASERDGVINEQLFEQMFLRAEDLQRFVLVQLRWPEEQLAEQLHQRLKLIAYELCEASLARIMAAFTKLENKSSKWTASATSFSSPTEMIQLIDLVLDIRHRSQTLCTFNNFDQMSYHSKIDNTIETTLGGMQSGLMSKMLYALESTLTKLARYDEGNLLAPILSLTNKQGMTSSGRDIGKQYASFVFNCCDLLRHKINDELWIVNLLEEWYAAQMNIICSWLGDRIDRSLNSIQLLALTTMVPKIYNDMSLQGVSEDRLNLKSHQTIMNRLKMEEACSTSSTSSAQVGNQATGLSNAGSLGGTSPSSGNATTGSGQAGNYNGQEAPSSNPASSMSSIFSSSMLSSFAGYGSNNSSSAVGSIQTSGVNAASGPSGGSSGYHQQLPSSSSLRNHNHYQQSFGPGVSNNPNFPRGRPPIDLQLIGQQQPNPNAPQTNDQQADNIADRALQSATRMFKGFWS